MIDAFVVVGFYQSKADIMSEAVQMEFMELPRIGDVVIPNAELKAVIDRKRKAWELDKDCPLNYVRGIAWVDGVPVVILSTNPANIAVDIVYGSKIIGTCLRVLPRINDTVVLNDESFAPDELYVHRICHARNTVLLFVGDKPVDDSVTIGNESIDVRVVGSVDANVLNVVDTNINKCMDTVDVNLYAQSIVVDVRTRGEDY